MSFTIRKANFEDDFENYYRLCFPLFKEKFYSNSDEAEEELFKKHRDELKEIDFDDESHCLFVAHNKDDEFSGAVWVGMREQGDIWDAPKELPAWIYDLEVDPKFRGQGLGKQLMLQAENWAIEKGIPRIGLHTSEDLVAAIKLYRSLNYEDFSLILRKQISKAKDQHIETKFDIKALEKDDDLSEYYALRLESFRTLISDGENLTADEIVDQYPRFKPKPDFDDSKKQVFIATYERLSFAGLIYGQKEPDAAWIGDIQVIIEYKKKDINRLLLNRFEQWAKSEEYHEIAIFLNVKRDDILDLLQLNGYRKTNYFMDKQLQ
jgi:GNAT superfamily N-acetyltransferase